MRLFDAVDLICEDHSRVTYRRLPNGDIRLYYYRGLGKGFSLLYVNTDTFKDMDEAQVLKFAELWIGLATP